MSENQSNVGSNSGSRIPVAKGRIVTPVGAKSPLLIVDHCPFCSRCHEHRKAKSETNRAQRLADCEEGEYLIEF